MTLAKIAIICLKEKLLRLPKSKKSKNGRFAKIASYALGEVKFFGMIQNLFCRRVCVQGSQNSLDGHIWLQYKVARRG